MTDEELGFGSIAPHFQEEPKATTVVEVAPKKPVSVEKKPESKGISDRQIGFKQEPLKPDWATNAVKQSMEQAGPVVAAEPSSVTDSQSFMHDLKNVGIGSAGTLALLGLGAGGMYLYNKSKGGKPPDNNTPPPPPSGEGTSSQNQSTVGSTSKFPPNEIEGSTIPTPEDIKQTPGYQKLQNLENVANGPLPNEDEATLIRNSERNKASKLVAEQAGVTNETTPAEADTMVASREAALDPKEKAVQKQQIKNAIEPKPFKISKEEVRKSQGSQKQILNYLGYDAKNPDSIRSKDALTSFEMLRPDLEGKASYRGRSGNPHGYDIYRNFIDQNISSLPESTQVFLSEAKKKVSDRSVPPPNQTGNVNPELLSNLTRMGLGGLVAMYEGQNAKQAYERGDTGMAASHLSQIANLTLPGMVANGLFGINPEELQTLRSAEQARKVGSGRGVKPPSAYR